MPQPTLSWVQGSLAKPKPIAIPRTALTHSNRPTRSVAPGHCRVRGLELAMYMLRSRS